MGKRKSRAKPTNKQMDRLDTVFSCPFCNSGTDVECHFFTVDIQRGKLTSHISSPVKTLTETVFIND
ncbi:hypothetical protein E1A91_A04G044400v1 [Gossypium mustelinum]|uniref:Transcription elongation factor 1 homolog n=1 Tax=Gossypium mustelinum TaxID=34275 RepID=A0A5D2ZM45_GOSMU|nr:hypothetical protein E1A91_A04G044400v1 [Gossypium mustelinum]